MSLANFKGERAQWWRGTKQLGGRQGGGTEGPCLARWAVPAGLAGGPARYWCGSGRKGGRRRRQQGREFKVNRLGPASRGWSVPAAVHCSSRKCANYFAGVGKKELPDVCAHLWLMGLEESGCIYGSNSPIHTPLIHSHHKFPNSWHSRCAPCTATAWPSQTSGSWGRENGWPCSTCLSQSREHRKTKPVSAWEPCPELLHGTGPQHQLVYTSCQTINWQGKSLAPKLPLSWGRTKLKPQGQQRRQLGSPLPSVTWGTVPKGQSCSHKQKMALSFSCASGWRNVVHVNHSFCPQTGISTACVGRGLDRLGQDSSNTHGGILGRMTWTLLLKAFAEGLVQHSTAVP